MKRAKAFSWVFCDFSTKDWCRCSLRDIFTFTSCEKEQFFFFRFGCFMEGSSILTSTYLIRHIWAVAKKMEFWNVTVAFWAATNMQQTLCRPKALAKQRKYSTRVANTSCQISQLETCARNVEVQDKENMLLTQLPWVKGTVFFKQNKLMCEYWKHAGVWDRSAGIPRFKTHRQAQVSAVFQPQLKTSIKCQAAQKTHFEIYFSTQSPRDHTLNVPQFVLNCRYLAKSAFLQLFFILHVWYNDLRIL